MLETAPMLMTLLKIHHINLLFSDKIHQRHILKLKT